MAEHLYLGPLHKQLRGNFNNALLLEHEARGKVGYLFASMMPGQTFKSGSWIIGTNKIVAFVWNDVLGKRALVRLFASFDEPTLPIELDISGFIYYPNNSLALYGWGDPYEDNNGDTINPPLGSLLTVDARTNPSFNQYRRAYKTDDTWVVAHNQLALGGSSWKKIGDRVLSWNGVPGWQVVEPNVVGSPIWYLGTVLCDYPGDILAISWVSTTTGTYIYVLNQQESTRLFRISRKSVSFKSHKVYKEWISTPVTALPSPKENWIGISAGINATCNEAYIIAQGTSVDKSTSIYKLTWPDNLSTLIFILIEDSRDSIQSNGSLDLQHTVEATGFTPDTAVVNCCDPIYFPTEITVHDQYCLSKTVSDKTDWEGSITMPVALDYDNNDKLQIYRIKAVYSYHYDSTASSAVSYIDGHNPYYPNTSQKPTYLYMNSFLHERYIHDDSFTDITLTINNEILISKRVYSDTAHWDRNQNAEWPISSAGDCLRYAGIGSYSERWHNVKRFYEPMVRGLNPSENGWTFIEGIGMHEDFYQDQTSAAFSTPNHQCQFSDWNFTGPTTTYFNKTEAINIKNSAGYELFRESPFSKHSLIAPNDFLFSKDNSLYPDNTLYDGAKWELEIINLVSSIAELPAISLPYTTKHQVLWMPNGRAVGNLWWANPSITDYISEPFWSEGDLPALTAMSTGNNEAITLNPKTFTGSFIGFSGSFFGLIG